MRLETSAYLGDYTRQGGNGAQICHGKIGGNGGILGLFGPHPERTERHWRET
jgi:hypothetical protein